MKLRYLQSFFGLNFGNNADIDIILDNQDERKMAEIKDENGRKERLFLFYDGESVTGKVHLLLISKCQLVHSYVKNSGECDFASKNQPIGAPRHQNRIYRPDRTLL